MLFNEPKLLKLERMQPKRQIRYAQLSVLFNEPKLLKSCRTGTANRVMVPFSALQRAEIAEISVTNIGCNVSLPLSVLFNEPKLLKFKRAAVGTINLRLSVLFNEPKLLKSRPPLPAPPVSQIPIPARRRS